MHPLRRLILVPPAVAVALLLLSVPGCTPGVPDGNGGTGGSTGKTFNTPPTAMVTADVVRGIVPLTVHFDSSRSSDAGGYIASRNWDFGDGGTATDIAPTHVFTSSGQFTVTLTVADNEGATATDSSVVVSATQAPVAIIQADSLTAEYAPAMLSFDGSNSYDPDGSIASYLWDFGDGAQETLAQVEHTFSRPGNFRVRLTVTDNVGVKSYTERVVVIGIAKPVISFRVPDDTITNIVLAREAPLWIAATYEVEPGTPYMISAGLDRDRDACDAQAVLYDPLTGDLLHRLTGAEEPVRTAAFSPDGSLVLLAGDDGQIRLYDVDSGELLSTVNSGAHSVTSLAFSPDGSRYICGAADGSLELRDSISGAVLRTLQWAPNYAINSVAFSPAGRFAASGSDDASAVIWDTLTGNLLRLDASVGGHTGAVNAVAFSPTNFDYFATGSADHTAKVWQLSHMAPLMTCVAHTDEVTSVAFSPDGLLLATGSRDQSAALWNVQAGAGAPTAIFSGFGSGVTSLAFSPDRTSVLIGCADGAARIFDIATHTEVRTLQPCSSEISSACYDKQGSMILLGVAAANGIRLDTVDGDGPDLDVRVPKPLDLRHAYGDPGQPAVTDNGLYYLWVAVDTDVTEPVRTYANATVQIIDSATQSTEGEIPPTVPRIDGKAVVVAAATPARQVFDLGPLTKGDQLKLSLAAMPGYGSVYEDLVLAGSPSEQARFSILVLDAAQEMFAWYQNPGPFWDTATSPYWSEHRVPFSAHDALIIGHDSPHYYLVLDGCTRENCGAEYLTPSVGIEVVPEVGLTPRQQQIYLDFDTSPDAVSVNGDPINTYPFDITDLGLGPDDRETVIEGIESRLMAIFSDYDVTMTDSAAGAPAPPYLVVYFCGGNTDFLSWSDCLDPRNQTRDGAAYVFTNSFKNDFTELATPEDFAAAFANVAAQQIGLLVGLRNTAAGLSGGDMMDPAMLRDASSVISSRAFLDTLRPLNGNEQGNGSIGMQNAHDMLLEIIGPR